MAALAQARFYFDRNDLKNAKAQLQWALDHSKSEEMRDLARLRLAGVLVDEKSYDEAIKLLEAKHAPALEAQYAALRGDALAAKNRPDEAKAAYRVALEKADTSRSPGLRESVQIRLDALGG
jgi:predicted negative regulator of RcsB-dependent stress response